jgi:hypothetical protein
MMFTQLRNTAIAFLLLGGISQAQTDNNKTSPKDENEFAKKPVETKLTEVVSTDSVGSGDLVKRMMAWIKLENNKFKKNEGGSNGSKVECLAVFPAKPRELNPEVDYTGRFTMKVMVECKTGKYRYTISDIKHISKSGTTSGGNIDNKVPECGSMAMHDVVWKKLRGEALTDAALLVEDLKEGMKTKATEKKDDW